MDRRVAIAKWICRTRHVTTLNAGGPQVIDFVYGRRVYDFFSAARQRQGGLSGFRVTAIYCMMPIRFYAGRDLALTSGGNRVATAQRGCEQSMAVKTSGEAKQVSRKARSA